MTIFLKKRENENSGFASIRLVLIAAAILFAVIPGRTRADTMLWDFDTYGNGNQAWSSYFWQDQSTGSYVHLPKNGDDVLFEPYFGSTGPANVTMDLSFTGAGLNSLTVSAGYILSQGDNTSM